ncbi:MAG TPA: hypothetical protein VD993_18025 [Chitinophagaceae bacterium]|nr:hypothetical protein [Chitinophagaceae bacterium]
MIKLKYIIPAQFLLLSASALMGQDNNNIFFTTGVGIIKSPGSLSKVFHPSIAFNSGIEVVNKKNWFLQGTLDFNSLKYNQRIKEDGSPYLFYNTNSSLVMLALNGGKNFSFRGNKWFASAYTGGGYLNLGEPRLINVTENTIRQEVSRRSGVFGKVGTRLAYKSTIKFLQTIYFDGAFWASPLTVQGSKFSGISLSIGARMSMK